jgi:hypothetical protein
MALPRELPSSWINCDVKVAIAAPMTRKDGSLDFPMFHAKILADYPEVMELETVENVRLYPKAMVAYLVKDRAVVGVLPGSRLIS